ncbi:MAG: ferrous iron transport protein B [Promethearchaeota archaeon Loki_b32]|nr:MAG: ferrous iron transport protein B [Candidatus Lokiarchaeota archaeon Loki_b32]
MSNSISKKRKISKKAKYKDIINIALAGNANVGKSVIFNQLTGLSQTIGNWPGKTVEKMEGHLNFLGYHFNIVDLPGIYSLSTYSLEEIISRAYIVSEEVDIIINVIDATNLERNLFFTFQLLELKVPMILAINQMDIFYKRNLILNFKKLEDIFKLPVIPVVAVHGKGVHKLLEEAIELVVYKHPTSHYIQNSKKIHEQLSHDDKKVKNDLSIKKTFQFPDLSSILKCGKEVETKVYELIRNVDKFSNYFSKFNYPSRFLAIKILERDEEIEKLFKANQETSYIIDLVEKYRKELEEYHGEDISTIISSEIYTNIHKIIEEVVNVKTHVEKKLFWADKIDHLTTHSFWGYVILALILFGIYFFTFLIGDFFGGVIEDMFEALNNFIYEVYGDDNLGVKIFWEGGLGGLFGAVGGVLVYVIPFFLIIEILQDSGYLPRAAYLMDRFMHSLGVHGKTIIPMILGFGCNVPACTGCRIMETEREKKISIALTSLVPCAAVMTVVLGLVGRYVGITWVLILFVINFIVIIIVGKILNKILPGQCTELIMEMHEYRVPNYSVILKQTWVRTKEFIYKAMPIIIISGIILEILFMFRLLDPVNSLLSPITVYWLGLPAITGIFLIYGILRKELTLVLLALLANSMGTTLLGLLTPFQMIIFSLVTMLYIPCFATVVLIAKETNWKFALKITLLEIGMALLIGGIINWGFIFLTSF